jgi:hypothetical protein
MARLMLMMAVAVFAQAGFAWDRWLPQNRPGWIPAPNPNNARILQLFGDQGGY